MKKILLIQCSPRGEQSNSRQLAEHFAGLLQAQNAAWQIDRLDLWREALPPMDSVATSAKYAVMAGNPLDSAQSSAWRAIEDHFQRFSNADAIIIALPVWNFSIPYVLKHYIDVITQPGLCFTWSPETGYTSLLSVRSAVIVSSSASDYRDGAGNEQDDFGLRYLERWLSVYMACTVTHLAFAPTVQAPTVVDRAKQQAYDQAAILVKSMNMV